MANPTIFEYQIQDDQGLKNRSALFMAYDGATQTVDALIGGWLAYGGLIDPCIDGKILEGRITIPLERDASWKSAAVVGNNVNQVMNLNFGNDFNSYNTPLLLPSYKESTLTSNRLPNVGTNPLLALVNAVVAGSGANFPNSRDLHDLNRLVSAFLTVRKVAKQKDRTRVITS